MASVRPATEAVEPVAERRQRVGDVAPLDPREHAPELVVRREIEGRCLDRVGHDRLDEVRHLELPAPLGVGVRLVCERGDEGGHRLAIAVQEPEDARLAAGLERLAERLVLLEPRGPGPDRDGRDQEARRILGGTLIALGDGFAGGETRRIGVGR